MNLIISSFVFTFVLFFFSCSTNRPVDFHNRRTNPNIKTNQAKSAKDNARPSYIIETVHDGSSTNSTTNLVLNPNPSLVLTTSAPTTNQTANDPVSLLKSVSSNKKSSEDMILNQMNAGQLESALKEPELFNYKQLMLWQAAQLNQKEKKFSQALEYYRALSTQYPQHHLAPRANSMINLIQATQEVDSKVIGAILPLTGKNANVGQHVLNALKVALGLNKPDSKFKLAIYDTQSQPEQAANGVDKLILDDKVIALIGGLSSKEATVIAQRAEFLSIPFIGLSQKSGLTNLGDFIFRNSLTPEMQIDQLVQYATDKLSAKKFAVLYPNDSYGVEFSNIYWDHVLARGGQITAAQTYDPKETDFSGIIQKMVGTYYPEARSEEFKERLEELKKIKKEKAKKNKDKPVVKNTREHEVEESVLQPVVDFDVLFIPDSGKTLGQVMAFMKVNDVNNLTYLGTNIWNTQDLVKRASGQKDRIFFVDAIDPNDSSVRNTEFYKQYLAEFNEEPTLIEMQTYESAKIIKDMILSGGTTRESLVNRLRIMGRSQGVTGELKMSNQREIERPIHILSLDNGLIKKIN